MAQRKQTVRLCDRCGSDDDVKRYVLRDVDTNGQVTSDVCASCRATSPLGEWTGLIRKHKDGRRRKLGRLVVDQEVVDKAAKRRPRV